MRKSKEFVAFGVEYRSTQLAAVPAFAILAQPEDIHPCVLFEHTEVKDHSGVWQPLSSPKNVDEFVVDVTGSLAPRIVLNGVIGLVRDHNFGFLHGWQSVKIPMRFQGNGSSISSAASDPMIAQLISQGSATLRELEEYYSLFDAFKMFDILVADSVNEARANEAASKAAKKR